MTIYARLPVASAFAPFGTFIDAPDVAGDRRLYSEWLRPVAGLSLQFHTNRVAPAHLPVEVTRFERHPHSPQVFVPLRSAHYLITVAPARADGRPDVGAALAFMVPPTVGVAYRAGVWHTGIVAVDTEASFAVLMWRGAVDDDVFAEGAPLIVGASMPNADEGGVSHG